MKQKTESKTKGNRYFANKEKTLGKSGVRSSSSRHAEMRVHYGTSIVTALPLQWNLCPSKT